MTALTLVPRFRFFSLSDQVNGLGLEPQRTKQECINKANAITQADLQQLSEGRLVSTAKKTAAPAAAAAPRPAAPTAPAPVATWSSAEQAILEAGLGKYPATMEKKERWTAISGMLPGKTKKDCVTRFKWIRQQVLSKKAAAGK